MSMEWRNPASFHVGRIWKFYRAEALFKLPRLEERFAILLAGIVAVIASHLLGCRKGYRSRRRDH